MLKLEEFKKLLNPLNKSGRFSEGEEGKKEFDKWMAEQSEEDQEEWEKQNDKYEEKFKKNALLTLEEFKFKLRNI